MARFFTALILVMAVIAGSAFAQLQTAGNQKQPKLLTLEQQQELLEQLATLQRQTQQLLAAQQSLAAAAAAAGVAPQSIQQAQQQPSNSIQSSPVSTSSAPRQSSSSSVVFSRGPQSSNSGSSAQLQNAPSHSQQQQASKPNKQVTSPKSTTTHSSSSQHQHHHQHQPQQQQPSSTRSQQPPLPAGPQINWGKCPELEPSESEKMSKAGVITKCLETTPLPGNITRESVEQHREQIAACALRAEGWFTSNGNYDYSKAEKEIKNKRLQKDLEVQVLSYHSQCKAESEEKYPSSSSSIIAQIQLYQACMDYFISDVCGIEVNEANDHAGQPQFN